MDERIARVHFIALPASLVIWWLIIAFIDSSLWKLCVRVPAPEALTEMKESSDEPIDEDIIKEEKNVENCSETEMPIKIYGANKNFSNFDKCKLEKI